MGSLNKRCFAFGCSYTNYIWPTFADLIGCNFDEFYNFGLSGADNTYALNRLMDAHSLFTFNPDTDLILFGVTGFGRFTYWDKDVDWLGRGDVNFSTTHSLFPDDILKKEKFSPIYAAYRSVNAVKIFHTFLEAIKIPHIIYPAIDNAEFYNYRIYKNDRKGFPPLIIEECENLQKYYNLKISIDEYLFGKYKIGQKVYFREENRYDTHPSTDQYYGYLKKYMPEYDTKRTQGVVSLFNSKEYKNTNELNELMAKKFALLYRKDISVEPSLFLRLSEQYTHMLKSYRDSGV